MKNKVFGLVLQEI